MSFWNSCWHKQTSPPDEMGKAICMDCEAVVVTTFTKALMLDMFDTLQRDFGGGRRHSKRCVLTEDREWVCATECRL